MSDEVRAKPEPVIGYAITRNGEIDIKTVYGTERGAKVNAISVILQTTLPQVSDEVVEYAWRAVLEKSRMDGVELDLVRVKVEVINLM